MNPKTWKLVLLAFLLIGAVAMSVAAVSASARVSRLGEAERVRAPDREGTETVMSNQTPETLSNSSVPGTNALPPAGGESGETVDGEGDVISSLPDGLPVGPPPYVVTVDEGLVVVTGSSGKRYVTDIPTDHLRPQDQAPLLKGIPAATYEELLMLLEDFQN